MHFRYEIDLNVHDHRASATLQGFLGTASPEDDAAIFLSDLAIGTDRNSNSESVWALELDCSGVTHVCSSGIAWLVQVRQQLLVWHYPLRLIDPPPQMVEVLELLELDRLFATAS